MPRLEVGGNPVSAVASPLSAAVAKAAATGRGSDDPGRLTSPFVFLGSVPSDPPNLPDDGVCRMWFRDDLGQIRVSIGGVTSRLTLTAV